MNCDRLLRNLWRLKSSLGVNPNALFENRSNVRGDMPARAANSATVAVAESTNAE